MSVRDMPLKPMTTSGHCRFGSPPAHHKCKPLTFRFSCDCPCHTEEPQPGRDTPDHPRPPAATPRTTKRKKLL